MPTLWFTRVTTKGGERLYEPSFTQHMTKQPARVSAPGRFTGQFQNWYLKTVNEVWVNAAINKICLHYQQTIIISSPAAAWDSSLTSFFNKQTHSSSWNKTTN